MQRTQRRAVHVQRSYLYAISAENLQEIWANAHETRDSISLITYAGCLGLSPVYFSENSLLSVRRNLK